MSFRTAELCDHHATKANFQICESIFRLFGSKHRFDGQISTLKVFENNSLVRAALEHPGQGRVLVIDGGGSKRCALLGEELARLAISNGWEGLLIYGCVRDADILTTLPIGIMALHTHPMIGCKHDQGNADVLITFAGVNFKKDHFLYADSDGIIVSEAKLD